MSSKTESELVEAALTGDEDAAQDAFAVACRDLTRLRRADKFACWVRSIAMRVAKRMARSGRERGLPEDTPAASSANVGHDRNRLVREAVMRLPVTAREVVVLHYFNGLSHKQIAAFLGTSPEAVHGRLVRARRKLADRLLRNGIGDFGP